MLGALGCKTGAFSIFTGFYDYSAISAVIWPDQDIRSFALGGDALFSHFCHAQTVINFMKVK